MTIDGVKLELYHFAPAHTSGDLIVYLPAQKIVSTGDIVVTNRADDNPNIHFEKNGSTEGWLANVKGMIALNADTYVTGHGDLLTKADLQRKLTATTERRNKIAAMVKEGKTLDEIKAALPDAPAPGAPPRGAARSRRRLRRAAQVAARRRPRRSAGADLRGNGVSGNYEERQEVVDVEVTQGSLMLLQTIDSPLEGSGNVDAPATSSTDRGFSNGQRLSSGYAVSANGDSCMYARHARFVSDLGLPVLELLAPRPGERILDLGVETAR